MVGAPTTGGGAAAAAAVTATRAEATGGIIDVVVVIGGMDVMIAGATYTGGIEGIRGMDAVEGATDTGGIDVTGGMNVVVSAIGGANAFAPFATPLPFVSLGDFGTVGKISLSRRCPSPFARPSGLGIGGGPPPFVLRLGRLNTGGPGPAGLS